MNAEQSQTSLQDKHKLCLDSLGNRYWAITSMQVFRPLQYCIARWLTTREVIVTLMAHNHDHCRQFST